MTYPLPPKPPVLITGGAGFIGTNLADQLLREGRSVRIFDNVSRAGVELNLRWLRDQHGQALTFMLGDVRDPVALQAAVEGVDQVYHFAAQVAVTTSLERPIDDFEVNARGTLNLLEAIRAQPQPPSLLFTSTNKVYGGLEDLDLTRRHGRYQPATPGPHLGIGETRPLDFHSPYGCSKGTADQYVLDYARSFGLQAVVFRMSCIYGPHQFGNEDQGWVAHFLIRAFGDQMITLYGDGHQVRDLLFVSDLVRALRLAQAHMPALSGQAFNIGGGPANAVSLLEVLDLIGRELGHRPRVDFGGWRTGDQRYYVSDIGKFARATGWEPAIPVAEGIWRLGGWLREARLPLPFLPHPEAMGAR